jgi:DNA-binding beta-propeller fold protein YncE
VERGTGWIIAGVAAALFEFRPQHVPDGAPAFQGPSGISCGASGDVLVVDDLGHRVLRFDSRGQFLSTLGARGYKPGQLSFPDAARATEQSQIVIADTGSNRIQVWEPDGTFITQFGRYATPGDHWWRRALLTGAAALCVAGLAMWFIRRTSPPPWPAAVSLSCGLGLLVLWAGLSYKAPRVLMNPRDLLVMSEGSVWVADTGSNALRLFDPGGNLRLTVRRAGSLPLRAPLGLALQDGRLYVTDSGNHRVVAFNISGDFISEFGGSGAAPGELKSPHGIAADAGAVYVADRGNNRVQVFGHDGSLRHVIQADPQGSVKALTPTGLCLTPDGVLLIVDIQGHRVLGWREEK